MMRKFLSLAVILLVVSCGASKKKTSVSTERKISVGPSVVTVENTSKNTKAVEVKSVAAPIKSKQIINTALTFSGTRYKFGGTTTKGMDCSGLLYVSFAEHDIDLPRASYQIAKEGESIDLKQVTEGDLLFFGTSNRKKSINHVGLVVSVDGDDIKFIHSTTSRGVIVSSLREGYWNFAFIKATRIL
ncbi:Murein DD-endopeptidase MepS/Murein LD-carboxypeptidase [Arenibacter antarcticus]|uniref:C40 family peptidase n=1 Tax=Arenibacter antarcticus TaxID=2040469 RepID=A0ABW5VIM4_9FLAO|nr:C40 family peptidase [Arenibacter sp. H213]MCM4166935.1 hydrolase [Arenibacter sp. H213]